LNLGFLVWFWATTIILAALLYRPVKRVIWLETNDPDQPVVSVGFTANVQ